MFFIRALRNKKVAMTCSAVLALIATFASGTIYFADRMYHDEKSAAIREANIAVDAFEQHTCQLMNQISVILNGVLIYYRERVAAASLLSPGSGHVATETARFIEKLNYDKAFIEDIFVVDSSGAFVIPFDERSRSATINDRDYFIYHQNTTSEAVYISPVAKGRISGRYRFRVSRRIDNPDGSFGGVIIATVLPESFTRYYRELKIGSQCVASLLSTVDKRLRARVPELSVDKWETRFESGIWELLSRSRAGSYVAYSPFDGITRSLIFKRVGDLPLVMVVGFSEEDIMNRVAGRRFCLFAGSAVIIAILLLITHSVATVILSRDELAEANKRLRDSNTSKTLFLSIIAHDIRNPVNTLYSYAQLLYHEHFYLSDQEKIENLRILYDSSKDLIRLIEHMLQWARNQMDRVHFVPERIDIHAVLKNAVKLSKAHATGKQISLRHDAAGQLFVTADPNMLRTVILNLVSNAIKYTRFGGKVDIAASASEGGMVRVSVRDDGIGMGPEIIEKLFSFDRSATRPGTGEEKGSGLGLVLCGEFLEKQGSRLEVKSEEGRGSEFYFSLPAA